MMKRERKHDSIRREKRRNGSEIKINQLLTGQKQWGKKQEENVQRKWKIIKGAVSNFSQYK